MHRRGFLNRALGLLGIGGAAKAVEKKEPPEPLRTLDFAIKADASPALEALNKAHRDLQRVCDTSAQLREAMIKECIQ